MPKLNAFTERGIIYFQATNLEEFKTLIAQAEKQAQQLNETVAGLVNFKFQFKFTEQNENIEST
jgi:hypothetical protein